jgi:hypothetical protein
MQKVRVGFELHPLAHSLRISRHFLIPDA